MWRLDRTGWAEILDLVTEPDLRRWRPTLLPEGSLRLRDTRSATVGVRKDDVIVRFGGIDRDVTEEWKLTERVVVGAETQPLAEVSAVAVLPAGAGVDGNGHYMLVDRAVGLQPLEVVAARGVAEP